MSPVWKVFDKLQRFEWLSSLVWFGFGWGSLEKERFPLARIFFTLAAFFLGLQIVSGSLRNLKTVRWRLTGAIVGLMAGLGFWAYLLHWVTAEETKIAIPFSEWLLSQFAFIGIAPWASIYLIAVVIVAATALFMTHARLWKLRCPDQRLHRLAQRDKESIKRLVRIAGISYQPCFDPEDPYLDFVVSVFNGSVFDVAVNNTIGTSYIFNNTDSKKFHYPARIESEQPIYVGSRRDNFFVIRQPLRFEEISAFQNKDKVLSLSSLIVTFSGEEVSESRLDTQHVIETQKGGWRAWDQLGFICSYSDERWAALQSGNVAHSLELEELRAKLKAKDALADPEIVAHEPYFEMVGKETLVSRYTKVGNKPISHHSDVKSAAFLDLFLKPISGTPRSVDITADIWFRGEDCNLRVHAGCWYGRDSPKVPLRHNETQSLFIVLYDGDLTTYENQYKARPLERSIRPEPVFGRIHLYGEYETGTINLNWWIKISKTADSLKVELIDEDVFEASIRFLD